MFELNHHAFWYIVWLCHYTSCYMCELHNIDEPQNDHFNLVLILSDVHCDQSYKSSLYWHSITVCLMDPNDSIIIMRFYCICMDQSQIHTRLNSKYCMYTNISSLSHDTIYKHEICLHSVIIGWNKSFCESRTWHKCVLCMHQFVLAYVWVRVSMELVW
jgi:hypothetical protein